MKRTPEVGEIVRIGKDKRAVTVLLAFPASGYVRVGDVDGAGVTIKAKFSKWLTKNSKIAKKWD